MSVKPPAHHGTAKHGGAPKHKVPPNGGAKHNRAPGPGGTAWKIVPPKLPGGHSAPPPKHHPAPPPPPPPSLGQQHGKGGRINGLPILPGPTPKKKTPPKRGFAGAWDAPCCVPEALAASLRMQGHLVSMDQVLELLHLTPGDDTGVSILDCLITAQEHGLAGAYPAWEPSELMDGVVAGVRVPELHTVTVDGSRAWSWGELQPMTYHVEEAWRITWL